MHINILEEKTTATSSASTPDIYARVSLLTLPHAYANVNLSTRRGPNQSYAFLSLHPPSLLARILLVMDAHK